jgi:hypothetical protein
MITPAIDAGRARLALVWGGALVLVAFVGNPLHEAGHWIGFRISNIPSSISFDHTYFTKFWAPSFAGALGGPLMSVLLSWVGIFVLYRVPRLRPMGAALAAFMPMTRLSAYVIFATHPQYPMSYNDEGVMGADTGMSPWTWAFLLLPLLVLPLVLLWHSLRSPSSYKFVYFLCSAVAWYVIGFKLEAETLDPWLFPQAQARELVMPHAPKEDQSVPLGRSGPRTTWRRSSRCSRRIAGSG